MDQIYLLHLWQMLIEAVDKHLSIHFPMTSLGWKTLQQLDKTSSLW